MPKRNTRPFIPQDVKFKCQIFLSKWCENHPNGDRVTVSTLIDLMGAAVRDVDKSRISPAVLRGMFKAVGHDMFDHIVGSVSSPIATAFAKIQVLEDRVRELEANLAILTKRFDVLPDC